MLVSKIILMVVEYSVLDLGCRSVGLQRKCSGKPRRLWSGHATRDGGVGGKVGNILKSLSC